MKIVCPRLIVLILLLWSASAYSADKKSPAKPTSPRFEITFPKEMSVSPLDGHMLLVIANDNEKEPRFQISFMAAESQQIFGVDVDR